jgi:hypothetical protein
MSCTRETKLHLHRIEGDHLNDPSSHFEEPSDQVIGQLFSACGSESLTGCAQVCLWVQGLQDPNSQAQHLHHVGVNNLPRLSRQHIPELEGSLRGIRVLQIEVCDCILCHGFQSPQLRLYLCKKNQK